MTDEDSRCNECYTMLTDGRGITSWKTLTFINFAVRNSDPALMVDVGVLCILRFCVLICLSTFF
jgi:hypothetical protein